MAYIFTDGFDCYAASADAIVGYWDTGNAGFTLAAGRFSGSQAIQGSTVSPTAAYLQKTSASNDGIHHIVFAIQQTAAISGTNNGFWFTLSDGATAQCSIVFRQDGAILLTTGASNGATLATYTGAVTATSTWYQFEIEVRVSNTAGYMNVRKLGNTTNDFASATNLDTAGGTANDYANRLTVGTTIATVGQFQMVDDLLWRSDSVVNGVAWVGDIRCQTRRPASDAAVQWTPSAAAVPLTPFVQNTQSNSVNTTARYAPFTPTVTGTVSTLSLVTGAGNTGNIKCTIFANSAGNTPGAILGSATTLSNTATGPITFTFPSPVSVSAATQYWVGFYTDTNVTNFFATTSTTSGASGVGVTYAAFPVANPGVSNNTAPIFTVYTAPTGVSGSNYGFVNEPQQDAANSYVYSSTVGQSDLYGISAIATTPASIVAVTTRAYLQKSDAGTRNTSVRLRSGGVNSDSASTALNTVFNWQYKTDVVDPATGLPWTAVGVANVQVGVICTA